MMDRSPRCYIQTFVVIGPLVQEKNIVEGFLPYMNIVNDVRTTTTDDRRRTINAGAWVYHKLTYEPSAQAI